MNFLLHPLLILQPEGFRALIEAFGLPVICAMIFVESGVFPMLPGDSLLVVCGIYAATPGAGGQVLSLPLLLTVVPLCAVLGSQVGFGVGRWAGAGAYGWKDRMFGPVPVFRREWLRRTEALFKRWGAFAVVVGRWVPFVRTGAPLLAGVTRMSYAEYVPFNIVGALSWVWSMVLVGYFLPPIVHRFAPDFRLEDRIDRIVLAVVFLSLFPVAYSIWKERRESSVATAVATRTKPKAKRRKQ
ncbi:MAG TPA: VTT domain-containing protein [bacterium]|nr:VTT domain-containing protein [bacterium]